MCGAPPVGRHDKDGTWQLVSTLGPHVPTRTPPLSRSHVPEFLPCSKHSEAPERNRRTVGRFSLGGSGEGEGGVELKLKADHDG